jgi:tRNA nucleotidyltransferase (CCA-adding enzyme)
MIKNKLILNNLLFIFVFYIISINYMLILKYVFIKIKDFQMDVKIDGKGEVMLVGGGVRDKKLGLIPKDFDWLVVGGTPEYYLNNGYEQVGQDFPVFLHPKTKDEYALARMERKVGSGYTGFEFVYDTTVTAEEDLFRRDLTINAMAEKENGELIDPFNGMQDIKDKMLRHVSIHFKEDPVRVLRVARFMARYGNLGFTVAPETMTYMKEMVNNGEVSNLTSERVFKELEKTFKYEPNPSYFFKTLRECGALKVVFPEIDRLFGVRQPKQWHPEIDTGVHSLMAVEQAKILSNSDFDIMFAALTHDLGKGITPKDLLPSHPKHEINGVPLVEEMCERLKVPSEAKRLALFTAKNHTLCHKAKELNPKTLLNLLKEADVFRRPELFSKFLTASEADARGRTGLENRDYDSKKYLLHILSYCKKVDMSVILKTADNMVSNGTIAPNEKGKQIQELINISRISLIHKGKFMYGDNLNKISESNSYNLNNFGSLKPDDIISTLNQLYVKQDLFILKEVLNVLKINNDSIIKCAEEFSAVKGDEFVKQGLKNEQVGLAIQNARLNIVKKYSADKNVTLQSSVCKKKPI